METLRERGIPLSMASAFGTIQYFSTVGSTFLGFDIHILLMLYVLTLLALVVRPSTLAHRVALPLSVLATWGRAEGFADLARGGVANVWGTAVLFGAVGIFMIVWHYEEADKLEIA